MRRDGAQRSAHDVAPREPRPHGGHRLLGHLLAEARRDLDERAGPDREAQIVCAGAPSRRATRQRGADGCAVGPALREEDRERAEAALVAANTRPSRALLPGLKATRPVGRPTSAGRSKARLRRGATNRAAVRFRAYERAAIASRTPSAPLASSARHAPHRSVASPSYASTPAQRRWIEQLEERVGRARLRARPHRSQRASE